MLSTLLLAGAALMAVRFYFLFRTDSRKKPGDGDSDDYDDDWRDSGAAGL